MAMFHFRITLASSYGDVQIPKVNFKILNHFSLFSSILSARVNSRVSVLFFLFRLDLLDLRTADGGEIVCNVLNLEVVSIF